MRVARVRRLFAGVYVERVTSTDAHAARRDRLIVVEALELRSARRRSHYCGIGAYGGTHLGRVVPVGVVWFYVDLRVRACRTDGTGRRRMPTVASGGRGDGAVRKNRLGRSGWDGFALRRHLPTCVRTQNLLGHGLDNSADLMNEWIKTY